MRISRRLRSLSLGVAMTACSVAVILFMQGCAKEEVKTADSSGQPNNGGASAPQLGPPQGGNPSTGSANNGGANYNANSGSGNAAVPGSGSQPSGIGGNNSSGQPVGANSGDPTATPDYDPSGNDPNAGNPSAGGRNTGNPNVGPPDLDNPTGAGAGTTGSGGAPDQSPNTTESGGSGNVGFEIGDFAPEITHPDLDGVEFSLSDYRGQVVMIDFWGHW